MPRKPKVKFEYMPDACQGCGSRKQCCSVGNLKCIRWKMIYCESWNKTVMGLRKLTGGGGNG